MNEEQFVQKNMPRWQKLADYNRVVAGKGVGALSKEGIREYAELYRLAGTQLAYARTRFANSRTTAYLNELLGVSHNNFYVKERSTLGDVALYFRATFPRLARENRSYFRVAAMMFAAGMAMCFVLALADVKYLYFFLPPELLDSIDLSTAQRAADYPLMSAVVMTNNVRVCFMAFVLGFPAGLGTLYTMFYNGALIGALTGFVASSGGSAVNFLALILPHGCIELTAVFLSGAAGLIIGKAVLMPGRMSRAHAVVKAARSAASLIPGIVAMLVCAGLIEGFFTPLPIPPAAKLVFAAATLSCLAAYFTLAGRETRTGYGG